MSVAVYDSGLRSGTALVARYEDGSVRPVDVARWCGPARGADETLLERLDASVLDIGCGPGRLLIEATRRGWPAMGIDIAPGAVRIARAGGGNAVRCSVFDPVPDAGTWDWALLVDGNIGIGGDPVRLLRRAAALLRSGGGILVEFGPPASGTRVRRMRLENTHGRVGAWFPWAEVDFDALGVLAQACELRVRDVWSVPDPPAPGVTRWFAVLSAGGPVEDLPDVPSQTF